MYLNKLISNKYGGMEMYMNIERKSITKKIAIVCIYVVNEKHNQSWILDIWSQAQNR